MEVIARAAVQGGEKREEENKEYMPSTKSSYYRLTQGLKSFWNSTGATQEIRVNNLFFLLNASLFVGSIFLFDKYGKMIAL